MNTKARALPSQYTNEFIKKHTRHAFRLAKPIVYYSSNGQTLNATQDAAILVYLHDRNARNDIFLVISRFYNQLTANGILIATFYPSTASKGEILGLLAYSGFTILEDRESGDFFWLAAQKSGPPGKLSDVLAARKLLFSQQRIGKNGALIKLYKVRTMYPFAHLIQDYLYKTGSIGKMGKLNNDYRVTRWGKWLRKYWIDELPQLINIVKGEMTLIGLRPLSQGFLKTLPADLQKERIKYLPGLIPPVYAEAPKNLEERIQAERKYLRLKKKYGLATDIVYFFRIFYAIVFLGQRGH
ncbi:sugar transferase [Candidatus Curtissbacteria bacterium]|nr:sugar transferase [Candidatus Curtissbacteria bacterium]